MPQGLRKEERGGRPLDFYRPFLILCPHMFFVMRAASSVG